MTNHYEILGVAKDANLKDIKKAYRKLSLEYHPDRNSTEEAISKMHAINEAYEILNDVDKRRNYDMELEMGHGAMPFQHMNSMDEFSDINQLFSMMFNGVPGMNGMPGMHGMQFAGNMGPGIRVFHSSNGPGNFRAEFSQSFHHQPPPVIEKKIELTIEQCFRGCSIPIDIERWTIINGLKVNEIESVTVTFPPGIDESDTLLLKGHGHSIQENNRGDVHLSIRTINRTPFKRQGLDLLFRKNISLKEALCGFTFDIPHINGKTFALNNTTNVSVIFPGFKKVIPNLGMQKENVTGNLIIELDIEFPDKLSDEQITALKSIL